MEAHQHAELEVQVWILVQTRIFLLHLTRIRSSNLNTNSITAEAKGLLLEEEKSRLIQLSYSEGLMMMMSIGH